MYPIPIDPNRPDNVPTQHTLQVHMHHLCCPCNGVMYPYYPSSYRPQILAQPQPIARPSYLHHYQYTQLHVNPSYNVPLQPSVTQHLPQTLNQSSPTTVDLAFGPPPRERRNLDGSDYDEQRQIGNKSKNDARDSLLQYTSLSTVDEAYCNTASAQNSYEGFVDLSATQVANMPTDSYITYLVNGCVTGEKIAKRNEHRPCFKNIQNLCNRTRSEVVKPNITVSNIHSQGMPWATKDFIFAFVRAINCWCILRGYLGSKDGNLGKIDREISPEFRTCYNKWEKCTKQLTYYLIDTFCKLDEANSPGSVNLTNFQVLNNFVTLSASTTIPLPPPPKTIPQQESSSETLTFSPTATQSTQTTNKSFTNTEVAAAKGIPGILHIPYESSTEMDIPIQLLESPEASQPEDDSESESRIYMKPGSYNIPKKRFTTPRSIEFLETAQNVGAHKKKLSEKHDLLPPYDLLRDQLWQTAKNVTPKFIQQIEEAPSLVGDQLYDLSVMPFQNTKIEKWLNSEKNNFNSLDPFNNLLQVENALQASTSCDGLNLISGNKPVTVLKRSKYNSSENNGELTFKTNKKRGELDDIRIYRRQQLFKRTPSANWECKKGKLTDSTTKILHKVFTDLERTDFAGHVTKKMTFNACTDNEINNPTNLNTVGEKLKRNSYTFLSEFVHDIRHIMSNPNAQCADRKYLKHLAMFKNKFDELLELEFPNVDFKNVTGDSKELFDLLSIKQGDAKKADGDGDH